MDTPTSHPDEAARTFWASVLASGAVGDVPKWPGDSGGPVRHEVVLPVALRDGAADLAGSLGVPVQAVLLAAHGAVVAALAGEREVCTGYRPESDVDTALPCRLRADGPDWQHLVRAAAEVHDGTLAHRHHPIDELRAELGVPTPRFEAVLDLAATDDEPDLPADVVVWTSLDSTDTGLRLRLRAKGDVADEAYLTRVAGYYATALATLITDSGSTDPSRQSVLPEREYRWQLDDLTGPARELPDRRMHELFEERVAAHPERIAATHASTDWTYAELNSRANRIAHALLARGVTAEQVVAVVTERNLDWLASVLAVFKAGGVYLPVEPHFPAGRVAAMLARSECRIALTEPASRTQLDEALHELADITVVQLDSIDSGLPDTDPGVPVGRDQLAYIYFTSGSTGEPKGAMCEQAGMLNHLFAKIDDLAIEDGQTVAQIAPQCFDISLWQLVSALLVGGRTLIVEQEVVLDVPRCVELIAGDGVSVMQVVPSYLEVLLAHLDNDNNDTGGLGALHCVSATGEALKAELVERWFARFPDIKLVNAYGLTETSDDTNHEVLTAAPPDGRVPLGSTVSNVWVGVVDEQLSPVPLGAPGEIVFSGVCVGRGYINDEERTKAAFLPDPHRPGERLYRSGDFGRWLPGGKLEFLGRRDAQVKLRGFRIEIGEIENRLLAVAGVRDAAVVVAQTPEGEQQLVAFYGGASELPIDLLRSELGAKLPGYMVPSDFHRLDSLPLTGNGKIDKKALRAMAAELAHPPSAVLAPRTPTEQRLAAAWASVLRMPADQVGRDHNFFDAGGTSLSAVRLAIALDRQINLKDMMNNPVLADLAKAIDNKADNKAADTARKD